MNVQIDTEYEIVSYNATDKVKDAVFKRVLKYFIKNKAFRGENIHQNDNCIIDATSVLSDIADDIIKFKFKAKE